MNDGPPDADILFVYWARTYIFGFGWEQHGWGWRHICEQLLEAGNILTERNALFDCLMDFC
jgi:hypothetical protein